MKKYVMYLNSVFGRCEDRTAVVTADSEAQLETYFNSQLSENPYTDEVSGRTIHRYFKKDSPLYNYNPQVWVSFVDVDREVLTYKNNLEGQLNAVQIKL